jgi:hypothetical protein
MKRCIVFTVLLFSDPVLSASLWAQEKKAVPERATYPGEAIRAELARVGDLDFDNLPLEDIAERLGERLQIKVALDAALPDLLKKRQYIIALQMSPGALAGIGGIGMVGQFGGLGGIAPLGLGGIAQPSPESEQNEANTVIPPGFSCRILQTKLGAALDVFLTHYGLGSVILGDTLVIATAERAEQLSRQQPVRLSFKKLPLADALAAMSRQTGIDMILDEAAAKAGPAITVAADVLPLDRAVALVASFADLRAAAVGRAWLITTPARAAALEIKVNVNATAKKSPDTDPKLAANQALANQGLGGMLPAFGWSPGDVPSALLQTAGPAPRGTVVLKLGAAAKQAPRPVAEARRKMAERIDIDSRMFPVSFKEAVKVLTDKYGFPPILVETAAFKEENPEAAHVYDTHVNLPDLKNVTRAKVLKMILRQIDPPNATFLVRPGHVEVTTFEGAAPGRQPVEASFADKPLTEALDELADMTGISIVLDARAGDKGRTRINARLQQETNLVNAVRLLADMADLKLMVVNNVLYVTLRSNNATLPGTEFLKTKRVE